MCVFFLLPTGDTRSETLKETYYAFSFPSEFYTDPCACKRSEKFKRSKSAPTDTPTENTASETKTFALFMPNG